MANQQSPKSGDSLHTLTSSSLPDPNFSLPHTKEKNSAGHARLTTGWVCPCISYFSHAWALTTSLHRWMLMCCCTSLLNMTQPQVCTDWLEHLGLLCQVCLRPNSLIFVCLQARSLVAGLDPGEASLNSARG